MVNKSRINRVKRAFVVDIRSPKPTNNQKLRLELARMQQQNLNGISANTRNMLARLRAIQNKGKNDDLNMQRIKREQRMVSDAGNLLKAPNMFGPDSNKLNILDMDNNILSAPNTFKEIEGNKILTTGRPSLLNTKEVGNNLSFGYVT